MSGLPSFELPEYEVNEDGWGPILNNNNIV